MVLRKWVNVICWWNVLCITCTPPQVFQEALTLLFFLVFFKSVYLYVYRCKFKSRALLLCEGFADDFIPQH